MTSQQLACQASAKKHASPITAAWYLLNKFVSVLIVFPGNHLENAMKKIVAIAVCSLPLIVAPAAYSQGSNGPGGSGAAGAEVQSGASSPKADAGGIHAKGGVRGGDSMGGAGTKKNGGTGEATNGASSGAAHDGDSKSPANTGSQDKTGNSTQERSNSPQHQESNANGSSDAPGPSGGAAKSPG